MVVVEELPDKRGIACESIISPDGNCGFCPAGLWVSSRSQGDIGSDISILSARLLLDAGFFQGQAGKCGGEDSAFFWYINCFCDSFHLCYEQGGRGGCKWC